MGSSKGKEVTTGYKYFMGMHHIIGLGPVDGILKIKVADKVVWQGAEDEKSGCTLRKSSELATLFSSGPRSHPFIRSYYCTVFVKFSFASNNKECKSSFLRLSI